MFIKRLLVCLLIVSMPFSYAKNVSWPTDLKRFTNRGTKQKGVVDIPFSHTGEYLIEDFQCGHHFNPRNNTLCTSYNVIDSVIIAAEDSVLDKRLFSYSENGRMLSDEVMRKKGLSAWDKLWKRSYTYDSDGNVISYSSGPLQDTTWVVTNLTTLFYDIDGRIKSQFFQSGYGFPLDIDSRQTYSYDNDGNLINQLVEDWEEPFWTIKEQWIYDYDVNGNITSHVHEERDGNELLDGWRKTYTYDFRGNLVSYLIENWNGSRWILEERTTFTCDDSGNMATSLYEIWNDLVLVESWRYTYTYDSRGYKTFSLVETCSGSIWEPVTLYAYNYNSKGDIFSIADGEYTSSGWEYHWRDTYSYDSFGNITSHQYEVTNNDSIWEPYWRKLKVFDTNGNLISFRNEFLDWDRSEWQTYADELIITDHLDNEYSFWGHYGDLYYSTSEPAAAVQSSLITQLSLVRNYPNPFNPSTTVEYEVPEQADVTLIVYDINGRVVQTLVSKSQPAGRYKVIWDGLNSEGKQMSGGVYLAKLQVVDSYMGSTSGYSSTIKMVYLR
ncbi:MAG: T9SS type A sorting domain-containing protein [Candidatus Marinimicrobia bacterium]|nr:T9SS type A sorting domain-containing protein [Candidatus Neomarinimicrobiota bacterium]